MKANTLIDHESTWIKTPPQWFLKTNSKTGFYDIFTKIALQFAHSNSFWYKKKQRILILADSDPIEYGILCCSSLCLGFWFLIQIHFIWDAVYYITTALWSDPLSLIGRWSELLSCCQVSQTEQIVTQETKHFGLYKKTELHPSISKSRVVINLFFFFNIMIGRVVR